MGPKKLETSEEKEARARLAKNRDAYRKKNGKQNYRGSSCPSSKTQEVK
jgi:hypothetical protein